MVEERRQLEDTVGSIAPQYDYGLPGDETRSLLYKLWNPFVPYRWPVEREAGVKPISDEAIPRVDPMTGQTIYETPAEVDPGQYGEPEFGLGYMPVVRGAKAGLEFFGDLVMDPETRQRAADVMRAAPAEIIRQEKLRAGAASMGLENIRDPRSGEVLSTAESVLLAPATTAAGTAAAIRQLTPDQQGGTILGILGGGKAPASPEMQAEYQMLLDSGLSDEQAYLEMVRRSQTPGQNVPGSYFPVYRDEIEGDLRIVIDDGNRELIFKGPQLDPDKLRDATRPPSFFDFRKGSMREQNEAYREARRAWEETEYTPEQIDQMTGFFEDPNNGYLRIGVPAAVLSLGAAEKLGMPKGYRVTTTLEEVMNDPALYEQYPALRNIRIQDTPLFDWATNGSYNPETKTISLGSFKISEESGRQGLAGTLVHEIQHAIQHIEGQSGGANTAMFETPEYRKLEETVEIQRANLANATKQVVKGILGKNLLQGKLSGEQSFIKGFLGRQKPQKFSDLPEETQTEVLRGFKNYLHSKVQHDDEYNRKLHKGLSYEDAVASGQNLYGGYRERKEFIDLVGPDIVRALDANDKGLLRTAGFLKKTEDRLARASSANYQLYLSNPGETNARLASLYQTGIKKGKHYFVSSGDISPELAERFKTLFPESVDLRYSNFGPVAGEKELQTMEVLKHIPGSQLMQVGSPNVLREMVKGDLPTDRSQINDPRIPNYPYRSINNGQDDPELDRAVDQLRKVIQEAPYWGDLRISRSEFMDLVDGGLNTEYPSIGENLQKWSFDIDQVALARAVSDPDYESYLADAQRVARKALGDEFKVYRVAGRYGKRETKPISNVGSSVVSSSFLRPSGAAIEGLVTQEATISPSDVVAFGHSPEGEILVRDDVFKRETVTPFAKKRQQPSKAEFSEILREAGSPTGKMAKRINHVEKRIEYIKALLRTDELYPHTRKGYKREIEALESELHERKEWFKILSGMVNPPEQKAQGGPVGGLGVYFSKMQMQGA